ncbi:hypothetical protein C0995_001521 [Termitomyces sp. Mi166|nr:hypothetical protein C0995_001521 [Termitomyces sp. Mi166\
MSGRLASFRGPSTPAPSPKRAKQSEPPNSPSRSSESTYHRKTRTILQELRSITDTWDQLVIIDGLKAAKNLVDARTDLDNDIATLPDKQPRSKLVGPKLDIMDQCIADLDQVIMKLQKQFRRMNAAINNLEALFIEANNVKGWQWAHQEPLWPWLQEDSWDAKWEDICAAEVERWGK